MPSLTFKRSKFPLETLFKKFLKQYNCRATCEDEEGSQARRYLFDYQGGHFVAVFYDNYTYELLFLNIFEVPVARINLARSVCNHFNAASIFLKYYYREDSTASHLNLHLSMLCSTVDETLPQRLELFFTARRDFIDEFSKQLKKYERSDAFDIESDFLLQQRESFLAGERSLAVACPPMPRGNASEPLTVGALLDAAGVACPDSLMQGMEIDAELDDHRKRPYALFRNIAGRKLVDALCLKNGAFGRGSVLIAVRTLEPMLVEKTNGDTTEQPGENMVRFKTAPLATIMLTDNGSSGDTLYYRATIVPAPVRATRNGGDPTPRPSTFVLAHDLADPAKKLAEFNFMWKEAKDKLKEKNPSMTDEEILLAHFDDPDSGFSMYWGRRYLSQKRYLEALECFLSIYNKYSPLFFTLNDDKQELFLETCYYIGCCYNAMKQFDRAFFYLDHLRGSSKITHCVEYVNTIVNCGDPRVFSIIDGIYSSIKEDHGFENEDDEDSLPTHVKEFVDFLRIRRADACITFHELDNAEKEYKHFLNHPTLGDHAIDQLARIKQLRDEEKEQDQSKKK